MAVLASGHAAEGTLVEGLYRRYARDVFALAFHAIGTRADAEDVAQTTFLNAHRALLGGAKPTNERAWLLTIARNACCSRFRAIRRRPREEPLDESLFTARASAGPAPPVVDALRTLLPRQREALLLQAVHGCSTAEIGERLGLGASAVEALLFRARAALRDELHAREEPFDCARTEALVERRLDHELPAHEQAALRAHLRACASCATTARKLRARKRTASLLLLPWELLGRCAGLFGEGAGGVKAATVVGAIVVGASAAGHGNAPSQAGTGEPVRPSQRATAARTEATPVIRSQAASAAPRRTLPQVRSAAQPRSAPGPAMTPLPPPPAESGTGSGPAPLAPEAPSAPPTPRAPTSAPAEARPPSVPAADVLWEAVRLVEGTVSEAAAQLRELPPVPAPSLDEIPVPAPLEPPPTPALLPSTPAPALPLPPLP